MDGSDLRWRGAIAVAGGGERSKAERSDLWWRGEVSGGALAILKCFKPLLQLTCSLEDS